MTAFGQSRAMVAPAVGTGTLQRLRQLSTARGEQVLSAYLNLNEAIPPKDSLCAFEERFAGSGDETHIDWEALAAILARAPEFPHGSRAIATFFDSARRIDELVVLPCEVRPMVVLDDLPWLEPLASTIASGGWGVVVIGAHVSRLLRGGPRMLVEFSAHDHESSSSRERLRTLTERLLRAHRRQAFERLTVVASQRAVRVLHRALPAELLAVLDETASFEMQGISPREISTTLFPPMSSLVAAAA